MSASPQKSKEPKEGTPKDKEKGEKRKILDDIDEWQEVKKKMYAGDSPNKKQLVEDELGKPKAQFRNYVNSAQQARVEKFYTEQHKHQGLDFVKKMEEKYLKLDKMEMGIWEAIEYLDTLVDDSDPDTDLSQLQHALQTAESIRKKYPDEEHDWFPLTGLIHDLGKIMAMAPKMKEPQWAVVGDTYPVGVKFSDKIVFYDTFKANPDWDHKVYSSKLGIYKEGCGIDKLKMSWGHDEYLYQVCVRNGTKLPKPALWMIRYHSFYPWHRERAYTEFETAEDREMLKWITEFNQFDLYSKADSSYDVKKLTAHYKKVIAKYFPEKLKW